MTTPGVVYSTQAISMPWITRRYQHLADAVRDG